MSTLLHLIAMRPGLVLSLMQSAAYFALALAARRIGHGDLQLLHQTNATTYALLALVEGLGVQ